MDRGKKKGGCLKVGLWVLVGLIVVLAALYIIGITVGGADPISEAQTTPTGQTEQQTPTEPASTELIESTEPTEPTGNILLDAEVQVRNVMSGDGSEKLGEHAYVKVSKEAAKSLGEEEYIAFLNDRVKDSGYNWYTILFEDGTGIVFPGSSIYQGTYGTLYEDYTIDEGLGDVYYEDGKITYEARTE